LIARALGSAILFEPLPSSHLHQAEFIKPGPPRAFINPGPPRAFINRHEHAREQELAQSHRALNGASGAKQIIQQACTLKL
jgi:hypothetical protein